MKIGLVRSVFAAYEGWSLSKFIYGTPPEIIKIQNFLKKYSHLSPDYDFTLTDIYDLCQILPLNSDEYGIKVIKNSLYPIQENKNFLKTFQSLKNASLINVTNFPTMFDPHNSQIVSELFCNSLEENIVCEKEVFDEILRLIKNHGLRKHKIVNIIRFLDNRNLLTTELLSIIIEKCDRNCLHLLRGLFKAKCLDATNLNMILEDSYSYRRLNKFFKTLNNTHVVVNEHILKTLLNQKFYYDYITDILRLFVNYLNFDEDMLLTITQKHYMTEGQKFLVKTLIDHTLLNQSLLEFICKNHSDGFEQVVGILTDHQLLKPNEILLNEISNKNIPSAECASFLSFLDIQTLLNQEYIDLFLLNDKKSRTILTNVFQQLHAS
ncbi:MAG TPA: hypothetical protein VHM20_01865, partial [Gammaproteobacteria bacterium]|nr:hypothetical protein [Gammaproteobacteria bacterium]